MLAYHFWSGQDTTFVEGSNLAALPTTELLKHAELQFVDILVLADVEQ